LSTQIEVSSGILTGRFSTRNCNGFEKVKRLSDCINISSCHLIVYGDSPGDFALIDIANEIHYRDFI
jgi:phosphoserine phosphatase